MTKNKLLSDTIKFVMYFDVILARRILRNYFIDHPDERLTPPSKLKGHFLFKKQANKQINKQ